MAAGFTSVQALTIRATGNITANRGITLAGAPAGAGVNGAIARTSGVSGDLITVDVLGTTVAEAGAALATPNIPLEFNASNQVIAATAGKVIGRTVGTASGAGELLEIFLIPN